MFILYCSLLFAQVTAKIYSVEFSPFTKHLFAVGRFIFIGSRPFSILHSYRLRIVHPTKRILFS